MPKTDDLFGGYTVIGLTDEGCVIQAGPEPRTSSENLIAWGLHNLRQDEVTLLLSLPIGEKDRKLLELWHEGMTEEENYDLGITFGYQW